MLAQLVAKLSNLTGVGFASFVYRTKASGELSKYLMNLGASTENLYEKDVARLIRIVGFLRTISAAPHTILAAEELLASRRESLDKGIGNNSRYTCADTYTRMRNLPGVMIHNETGELYINGLVSRKTVLEEGTPMKQVKSAPKTISKRRIERMLPSTGFRTFCLGNVSVAKVLGDTIEIG